MRKERIAEWILSQVTSRERAVTTVGDLTESAVTRGAGWFWSGVLRTTGSLLWRGFADAPRPMLGLAFRAWLLSMCFALASVVCIIVLAGFWGIAVGMFARADGAGVGWATSAIAKLLCKAAGWGVAMLCQFQVGRWVAQRAPGRELSVWLALTMMQWIPSLVVGLGVMLATGDSGWLPVGLNPQILALALPLLAGALWVRRRAAR
jgi:hypothetical protein